MENEETGAALEDLGAALSDLTTLLSSPAASPRLSPAEIHEIAALLAAGRI